MKPVVWFGDSRARVKDFPEDARRETGYELEKIQDGRKPISSSRGAGSGH